jgi:hypothetical protein
VPSAKRKKAAGLFAPERPPGFYSAAKERDSAEAGEWRHGASLFLGQGFILLGHGFFSLGPGFIFSGHGFFSSGHGFIFSGPGFFSSGPGFISLGHGFFSSGPGLKMRRTPLAPWLCLEPQDPLTRAAPFEQVYRKNRVFLIIARLRP